MSGNSPPDGTLPVIGWKEWLVLPELGIPAIKAKIDTGARTSALHTFSIEDFTIKGTWMVRFGIHPLQKRRDVELYCEVPVVDRRQVKDSSGHTEMRYTIETKAKLGDHEWPIEITLTNRDSMMFRMLLGRTALEHRFTIDPARSYLSGRRLSRSYTGVRAKKGRK
jgi:hypothetical protein